ncbi:MAG: Cell division protein ZapA [Bacteroidota bacterium]|jgi:cell division protein ZapA
MNEVKLTVKIGNREYPVKVKEEDKAGIESALKFVQEKVELYEKNYPNTDMQDLLAMVLLQTASRLGSVENQLKSRHKDTEERLRLAEEYLSKSLI